MIEYTLNQKLPKYLKTEAGFEMFKFPIKTGILIKYNMLLPI